MAKNFRRDQNQEIKQIVADANIFGYTDKATISVIEQKTGIAISQRTLTRIKSNIKEESHEFLDNLTMSRYGYIEEYKKLIDTLKLALTQCWKMINHSEYSNTEKLAAIGKSNETIARLQSIYQYLPQIMTTTDLPSLSLSRPDEEQEEYDINKDPEAKF
jgi:uncharacterized protein YerC